MKRAVRGLTRINAFGEELPNVENRIELVGQKDEFGMPIARFIHSYDQDAIGLWNANFEEGLKIAKAAGATEMWSARGNMPTIHLMGGTIMGTGAGNSVVNSYGQTHEVPNLYIAGPGIFPTAGASNPTYTIFALSQRGAEHLATTWRTHRHLIATNPSASVRSTGVRLERFTVARRTVRRRLASRATVARNRASTAEASQRRTLRHCERL